MWYVCVWFLLIYPIYTQLFLIYEEEGGWLPPAAVAPLAPHIDHGRSFGFLQRSVALSPSDPNGEY